jgi:GNAT superfamily N-acetyltransferase
MGSTDDSAEGPVEGAVPAPIAHPLGTAYLDGLLALSRSANWNQDADDWRHMLSAGRGWGLSSPDGTLLASTVVLPYRAASAPFAWVSMVLVLPAHRRRGFASRLLRTALDALAADDLTPVLDATPDGHPVYRREGFVDAWSFARLARAAVPADRGPADRSAAVAAPRAGVHVEPLRDAHWPGLRALDARAFGGDRGTLLRAIAARLPRAAHVAIAGDEVAGFVLGRPGRVATQLGPLVATDDATGVALLDAALGTVPGPVFVDAPDAQAPMRAALAARGFALQRPFTRLVHPGRRPAPPPAPGDATLVRLVGGPELG